MAENIIRQYKEKIDQENRLINNFVNNSVEILIEKFEKYIVDIGKYIMEVKPKTTFFNLSNELQYMTYKKRIIEAFKEQIFQRFNLPVRECSDLAYLDMPLTVVECEKRRNVTIYNETIQTMMVINMIEGSVKYHQEMEEYGKDMDAYNRSWNYFATKPEKPIMSPNVNDHIFEITFIEQDNSDM